METRSRCESSRWKCARVTKLVKVVTDQFELRESVAAGRKELGFGHTEEVQGVEEKEMEQSPDDGDVISRLQKSIEVSVERTTKEVIVQNIQMIVEKIEKIEVHQLQFSYQMVDVQLRRSDDCR